MCFDKSLYNFRVIYWIIFAAHVTVIFSECIYQEKGKWGRRPLVIAIVYDIVIPSICRLKVSYFRNALLMSSISSKKHVA